MIRRDNDSEFIKNLKVSKRGNMRVSQDEAGADTHPEAKNVLKKFDKSPDIPNEYIKEHHERLEKGHDPKEVMTDFFKGLQKAKESKSSLSIKTAKLFRQNGIFKKADNDVYQDLESGDFWKISEDKKNIVRMFEENDGVTEGIK